jgi:hypothetical protein
MTHVEPGISHARAAHRNDDDRFWTGLLETTFDQ